MTPLLDYSTEVPVGRTVGVVHELLVRAGARQIMSVYSAKGTPVGVSFAVETPFGSRGFSLPVRVEKVHAIMRRNHPQSARLGSIEQAERVAWRIAKDWLEAQLALIETTMVTLDQVMLPYMQAQDGKTVYDLYVAGQLPELETAET